MRIRHPCSKMRPTIAASYIVSVDCKTFTKHVSRKLIGIQCGDLLGCIENKDYQYEFSFCGKFDALWKRMIEKCGYLA